jgi:hypothetical protein
MLAFMIGIAPIMIALSLFDVSKDYFHRWLSSTVSYALYPLVIAGVFSTVVGMSRSLMTELGDPFGASNIGALVPFFHDDVPRRWHDHRHAADRALNLGQLHDGRTAEHSWPWQLCKRGDWHKVFLRERTVWKQVQC